MGLRPTAAERIQQAYGWRGQPQLPYSSLFFAALQTRVFQRSAHAPAAYRHSFTVPSQQRYG